MSLCAELRQDVTGGHRQLHSEGLTVQVRACLDAGVNVGLGVDGSASNDCGSLLSEARLACYLQRAHGNVKGRRLL